MSAALAPEVAPTMIVEEGDEVAVEAANYQWATPLTVTGVVETTWRVPFGEDWTTRRLTLQTSHKTDLTVDVAPDLRRPDVRSPTFGYGELQALDYPEPSDGEYECDECGKAFDSGKALGGHIGGAHGNSNPRRGTDGQEGTGAVDTGEWPEFVARDPHEIVADSGINRTLTEILEEVERQATVIDVHRRLAAGSTGRTRKLLAELGLGDPNQLRLEPPATLDERIPQLREVADD